MSAGMEMVLHHRCQERRRTTTEGPSGDRRARISHHDPRPGFSCPCTGSLNSEGTQGTPKPSSSPRPSPPGPSPTQTTPAQVLGLRRSHTAHPTKPAPS